MIFKKLTDKEKADKYKERIIKKNVKKFKSLCIKEFNQNIKKGLSQTIVDFFCNVNADFEDEISERVLEELKNEYPSILFSFSYSHYMNSYKGIQMEAK